MRVYFKFLVLLFPLYSLSTCLFPVLVLLIYGKFHLLKIIFIYLYKAVYGSDLQLACSAAAESKSTEIRISMLTGDTVFLRHYSLKTAMKSVTTKLEYSEKNQNKPYPDILK